MLMCFLVMNSERNPAEDQLKSERIKCWYNFIKLPRSLLPVLPQCAPSSSIILVLPHNISKQFARTHFEPRLVVSGSHEVVRLSRTNINFLTQNFCCLSLTLGKHHYIFLWKFLIESLEFERTSEHNEESRLLSHNMKFMSRKSSFDWLWKGALGKVEGGAKREQSSCRVLEWEIHIEK